MQAFLHLQRMPIPSAGFSGRAAHVSAAFSAASQATPRSSSFSLFGRLSVPVIQPLDSRHYPDAAEVELVRARVVDDVVWVAGAIREHREPTVTGAEGVCDSARCGPRHHVSGSDTVLLPAQHADSVAIEDHEQLLFDGMAMRGRTQHPGRDPVVVDSGADRAGGDAEVTALDADVAPAPVLRLDLDDVDGPSRPGARRREGGVRKPSFES